MCIELNRIFLETKPEYLFFRVLLLRVCYMHTIYTVWILSISTQYWKKNTDDDDEKNTEILRPVVVDEKHWNLSFFSLLNIEMNLKKTNASFVGVNVEFVVVFVVVVQQ